jgi:hypothetical protein
LEKQFSFLHLHVNKPKINAMHIIKFLRYLPVALPLLLFSCVDNNISIKDADTTLAVDGAAVFPVAQSTITIKDFIDHFDPKYLTQDANDVMVVKYSPGTLYNFNLNFTPSDVVVGNGLNLQPYAGMSITPAIFNAATGNIQHIEADLHSLSPSHINQIDSIDIESMYVTFTLHTNLSFGTNQLQLTVIPDPACFTGLTQPSYSYTNLHDNTAINIPLSNFRIKTKAGSKITLTLLLQEPSSAGNISVSASSSLSYDVAIRQVAYSAAYGQFAFTCPSQSGSIDISFINDVIRNTSYLPYANPTVSLTTTTNARIPMTFTVDYLKSFNSATPSNVLWAQFDNGAHNKSFPIYKLPSMPGGSASNTLTFNKTNGKIDQLFTQTGINTISFSFSGQSRTDTVVANQFIVRNNNFQITPSAEIPLVFNAGANIQILDTLSLGSSFTDFLNDNNLDNVRFWLIANNFTSTQMSVGVTLLDAQKKPFSTVQNITLKTTLNVDANGKVIPGQTTTDQQFSLAFTADDLKKAHYIRLAYTLQGKDLTTPLTICASDFVKVKLSAYVKGSATIN